MVFLCLFVWFVVGIRFFISIYVVICIDIWFCVNVGSFGINYFGVGIGVFFDVWVCWCVGVGYVDVFFLVVFGFYCFLDFDGVFGNIFLEGGFGGFVCVG